MSEEYRPGGATSRSVSPRTVREFTAPAVIRGYDRDAVDNFMKEVAVSYEIAVRDLDALQRRLHELESYSDESAPWADETDDATSVEILRREIRKYREREHAVGAAFVSAQKTANELRSKAEREAEAIRAGIDDELEGLRSAAREEAERIVLEARVQAKKIEEEAANERSVFEQELDRLRSLKEATRQDLSEFLAQALHGLEESVGDDRAQASEAKNEKKAGQSASSS